MLTAAAGGCESWTPPTWHFLTHWPLVRHTPHAITIDSNKPTSGSGNYAANIFLLTNTCDVATLPTRKTWTPPTDDSEKSINREQRPKHTPARPQKPFPLLCALQTKIVASRWRFGMLPSRSFLSLSSPLKASKILRNPCSERILIPVLPRPQRNWTQQTSTCQYKLKSATFCTVFHLPPPSSRPRSAPRTSERHKRGESALDTGWERPMTTTFFERRLRKTADRFLMCCFSSDWQMCCIVVMNENVWMTDDGTNT